MALPSHSKTISLWKPKSPHVTRVGFIREDSLRERILLVIHTYWQLLSREKEKRLDSAESHVSRAWPEFLVASLIIGSTVTLLVRAAHMLGEWSDTSWIEMLCVIPGILISVFALGVLIWSSLNIRTARRERAYATAFLASAVATLVSVESAAGVTCYLARVTAPPGASTNLDLWSAERFYLWHLIELIPFAHPQETLGWSEPDEVTGVVSRSIVLLLKVVLVLPLAQVFISGFWWLRSKFPDSHQLQNTALDQWRASAGWPASAYEPEDSRSFSYEVSWMAAATVLVTIIGWGWIWAPTSVFQQVIDEFIPPTFQILGLGPNIERTFLGDGVRLITTVWWIWIFGMSCHAQFVENILIPKAALSLLFEVMIAITIAMIQAAALAALLLYVLIRLKWASVSPALPNDGPVFALIESQMWGLAYDIPGLEVTNTLGWQQPHSVKGFLPGVIVLALKTFVLLCLMTLILWSVHYTERRRKSGSLSQVSYPQEFVDKLMQLGRLLDRVPVQVGVRKRRRLYRQAKTALDELGDIALHVLQLFGPGEAGLVAKEALQEAEHLFDQIHFGALKNRRGVGLRFLNSLLQNNDISRFKSNRPVSSKELYLKLPHELLDNWVDEFVRVSAPVFKDAVPEPKRTSRKK